MCPRYRVHGDSHMLMVCIWGTWPLLHGHIHVCIAPDPSHAIRTHTHAPQHYAYALGSDGLHLIMDERGKFREENFAKLRANFSAKDELAAAALDGGGGGGRGRGGRGRGGRDGGGRDGGRGGRDGGRGGRDGGGRGGGGGRGPSQAEKDDQSAKEVNKLLRTIEKLRWLPVIFFSFARKQCEVYARSLKQFDFNTAEEAEGVEVVR